MPASPSIAAEVLHFFGEVEVVFGLWAVVLLVARSRYAGWETATHYFNDAVNYTEPLFVVVIMALAVDAADRRASPKRRCGAWRRSAAARRRPGGWRS